MGSIRLLLKREQMLRSASQTPSSHRGEAGDTGAAAQDLRDDVDLLEEGMSQMGASPKIPFRFQQSSWSPSEWSLTPECQQDHTVHEDLVGYCIHIGVILGEGGGNQPPPSPAWSGSLIVDMFQEGLKEWITKAVVLTPGEAILFFGWWSHKEGLPLWNTRDVGFSLMDPIKWASRAAQVNTTMKTVQDGCWAITKTVVEKKTKARGPGCPWRMTG